jgi:Tfp pilus assembly protein PilO
MLRYYKNKFLINIGAILAFFIFIAIFIIYPALAEISRVNNEITAERVKLERKIAMGLNMKKIVQDLEEIESTAGILDTIFMKRGQELKFVNQLETIAAIHDVDIDLNSDFVGEQIEANISQVEIKTVLTGNYPNIVKFLEEVENLPQYFNTSSLSITKNTKDKQSSAMAQLTSHIYLKK